MKKIFFLIVDFAFFAFPSFACPFCGCGNSNFQVGLLPTYSYAFVGMRYTYSHFNTLSSDGTQFSHDSFYTTELWGGYKIGKVQLMGFVPYVQSHKVGDDGNQHTNGLGDIMFLANYQVFSVVHPRAGKNGTYSQNLWAGGGVKFHTGASQVDVNDPDFTVGDFSSTPGTGSTDYLLNVTHNLLFGNNGVVTNAAYRINTANAQKFRYGNRLYVNAAFFHTSSVGLYIVRPSAGVNLVVNDRNYYAGQAVDGSQGYILSGVAGVNVQRGKIGFLANSMMPVVQDLFDHQTHFRIRASLSITFSI
jgi:hypothetical protein